MPAFWSIARDVPRLVPAAPSTALRYNAGRVLRYAFPPYRMLAESSPDGSRLRRPPCERDPRPRVTTTESSQDDLWEYEDRIPGATDRGSCLPRAAGLRPGHVAAPGKTFEQLLQASSTKAVIPIFSQLLLVPMPAGFKAVHEDATAAQYIPEAVPAGQTVDAWTAMLTVEGFKGLATAPGATPAALFGTIADGYQKSCPSSFSSLVVVNGPIGGNDGYAGVLSCGVSPTTGGKTSESALIAIIKGQADLYSVQWAERTPPSSTPIKIAAAQYAEG